MRKVAPSKPMSLWVQKLMAAIAKTQRARVDELARDTAKDADVGDRAEAILRADPTRTDDEVAMSLLPFLDFSWESIVEAEKDRVYKWVGHVVKETTRLDMEDEYYFDLDARDGKIKVQFTVWGEAYEYDPSNKFMTQVNAPNQDDLYDGALARAFKKTGADADVRWEFQDDPVFLDRSADILTFPVVLTWHLDEKALSETYGAQAFLAAALARMPEWRAEVAYDLAHEPVRAPMKRGARR